jgi:hypothetical protein
MAGRIHRVGSLVPFVSCFCVMLANISLPLFPILSLPLLPVACPGIQHGKCLYVCIHFASRSTHFSCNFMCSGNHSSLNVAVPQLLRCCASQLHSIPYQHFPTLTKSHRMYALNTDHPVAPGNVAFEHTSVSLVGIPPRNLQIVATDM